MPTAHALMGLLARGERHGYELRRGLEAELGPEWRLDFGHLYRVLASMKRKEWIAARLETGTRAPDRKVYSLTACGRAELERWLAKPAAFVKRGRDDLPVKMRFGQEADTLVAIGSDDLVLDLLARRLADGHPEIHFSASPVGSLSGLIALREGRAHLAGIHLLDVDSGEYNVPFVKHLMPEEPMLLMNLARREQGLIVAAGNPKGISRLRDLARPGVRLVNRQRGAGTRLLLFYHLRKAGIDPRSIAGYECEARTHSAVAAAIAAGSADVGPGIRAVAEAWGLEFIPLGEERYDLAIPRGVFESRRLRPLLEIVHHDAFRRAAAVLSGYDVAHMSEIVADLN